MFEHSDKPRLPLSQALRKYWLFLSGLVLFHFLMIFYPAPLKEPVAMCVLFFGAVIAAGWPWLFRDAPYTFWVFACVYWVVGLILMALLKAVLSTIGAAGE